MNKLFVFLGTLSYLFVLVGLPEATTIAGYDFVENAFADNLISFYGDYTTYGGDLAGVLTDSDPATYAYSYTEGAYVELGFTDNLLVNGTGADLALFDLGALPGTFKLTLEGTTIEYLTSYTNYAAGSYHLNVALVDLDDFGLGDNAQIGAVLIGMDYYDPPVPVPTLSLVGALNSAPIPEPATILLVASGLVGLAAFRRKKVRPRSIQH